MKDLNDIQSYVFVCIISADNDEFGLTEDQKQQILSRHHESTNWSYILECMPEQHRDMLIRFFEKTDEHHEKSISYKTLEPSEESSKEC